MALWPMDGLRQYIYGRYARHSTSKTARKSGTHLASLPHFQPVPCSLWPYGPVSLVGLWPYGTSSRVTVLPCGRVAVCPPIGAKSEGRGHPTSECRDTHQSYELHALYQLAGRCTDLDPFVKWDEISHQKNESNTKSREKKNQTP